MGAGDAGAVTVEQRVRGQRAEGDVTRAFVAAAVAPLHAVGHFRLAQPQTAEAEEHERHLMAGRDKGGREARKPKADKNKKVTGQTPSPIAGAMSADAAKKGKG